VQSVVENLPGGGQKGARGVARGVVRGGGSLAGAAAQGAGLEPVGAVVVQAGAVVTAVTGASPHGVLGGHGGGGKISNVDGRLNPLGGDGWEDGRVRQW